jgi:hypothetical protein
VQLLGDSSVTGVDHFPRQCLPALLFGCALLGLQSQLGTSPQLFRARRLRRLSIALRLSLSVLGRP